MGTEKQKEIVKIVKRGEYNMGYDTNINIHDVGEIVSDGWNQLGVMDDTEIIHITIISKDGKNRTKLTLFREKRKA